MDHIERTGLVVKLNSKLQQKSQVYVIIVTCKYLLKELQQLKTQQPIVQTLITETKSNI